MKKKLLKFSAALALSFGLLNSQNTMAQSKIAIIYNADSTLASGYDSLLTNYGFNVRLVNQPDVLKTDFDQYDLIIAGPNSSNTWSKWYSNENVDYIASFDKRLLALGGNASGLFTVMKLWINGGQCASSNKLEPFKAINTADSLFNVPYKVTLNNGQISPVTSFYSIEGLYTGDGVPSNVKTYLTMAAGEYSPFASENGKYFFYGEVIKNSKSFTEAGEKLFINAVYKAIGSSTTITSTKTATAANPIAFYPNPSTGILYLDNAENVSKIEIFTASQNLCYASAQLQRSIDLSFLPAGIYFARLSTPDKSNTVLKICLQK